jgi:curli biogenesis system outer membrane secretion channel CsgG
MRLSHLAITATLALAMAVSAVASPLLTVAVVGAEDRSAGHAGVDLTEALTTMLTLALSDSGQFIVLSRDQIAAVIQEQDFANSGRVAQAGAAAETGAIIPAQVLVRAVITEFDPGTSSGGQGLRIEGFELDMGREGGHMAVVVEMINATTGEVIATERTVGTPSGSHTGLGYSSSSWGIGLDDAERDAIGRILQITVDNCVEAIARGLRSTPWEGAVVTSRGGEVYINAGQNAHIREGEVFVVYDPGEALIDPATGLNLGSVESEVGLIEVSRVEERFSVCRPIDQGNYGRGQIVREP